PRWSPDGRSIAVERHRRGALSEIVVMDLATMETRSVAAIENARVVTPAWRPDGLAIVGAADIGGGPVNLFEFPLDSGTPRRLTSVTGGATWPDVSPDGATIAFVAYTTKGFDVFTMPYPAPSRSSAGTADFRLQTSGSGAETTDFGLRGST